MLPWLRSLAEAGLDEIRVSGSASILNHAGSTRWHRRTFKQINAIVLPRPSCWPLYLLGPPRQP